MKRQNGKRMLEIVGALILGWGLSFMGLLEASGQDLQKALPFIENQGQVQEEVAFYAKTFAGTVFVTRQGELVYATPGWAMQETFLNGRLGTPRGQEARATRVNYFKGKDPSRWQSDLPTFGGVNLGERYEGISITLSAQGNNVEKLFLLEPGANPERIRIKMQGAEALSINTQGQLVARTGPDCIAFTQPIAFQETDGIRSCVEIAYWVDGFDYGFTLGAYDPRKPLVIDPLLASTHLGGSGSETAAKVLVDNDGYVYVGGYTDSIDFPTHLGAYDATYGGGTEDAFLAKFNADLTTLIAATYLGGAAQEGNFYLGLALDNNGSIYMTGNTQSDDFPTTAGAYDETYNGTSATAPYGHGDVFVSRFDCDLTTLEASTLLGGERHEYCRSIALDSAGTVYLGGMTGSADFPVTPGAYDETKETTGTWKDDLFVAKLDHDLTTLQAATFIGGARDDFTEGLGLGPNGEIYVGGWTNSQDYPTTPNAFSQTYNGHMYDAFVSKLSNDLTTLTASTYFGGNSWDFGYYLLPDATGNIYITGHTASTDLPVSANAFDPDYSGTAGYNKGDDVFLVKFDPDLATVLACTYLGGDKWENAETLSLAANGNLYVAGSTSSTDFPCSPGAYSGTYKGGTKYAGDLFLTLLDPDLSTLQASTYFGGTGSEGSYTVSTALAANGDVYLTGYTGSSDYPTTPGAFSDTLNGTEDAVVTRLDGLLTGGTLTPDTTEISVSTGGTLNLSLDAGAANANRQYLILGSMSGANPGVPLPNDGQTLPVVWDDFTDYVLVSLNGPIFVRFFDLLDGNGQGSAVIQAPVVSSSKIGTKMTYAYCLEGTPEWDVVSPPVVIEFVP